MFVTILPGSAPVVDARAPRRTMPYEVIRRKGHVLRPREIGLLSIAKYDVLDFITRSERGFE